MDDRLYKNPVGGATHGCAYFCRGTLIPHGKGLKPSGLVYKKKSPVKIQKNMQKKRKSKVKEEIE